ncbi:MAG TPA: 30S ribosomal protein S17e [archaeon]|nr:30S ribosomal protein S17e [archaeon]
MGNIRTKDIKHAAFQIKNAYKDKLTVDFEKNKGVVKGLGLIENKRMRNRVVGYLTTIMKRPE